MTASLLHGAQAWLAPVLSLGALAATLGAALARSLFSMCAHLAGAAALIAVVLMANGMSDAALAEALFGVGLAPVLLLATLVLTTRAAKPRRQGWPWLTAVAAVCVVGAALWGASELEAALAPANVKSGARSLVWLGPLMFVAVAACVGLLGYGERGALQHPERGRGP